MSRWVKERPLERFMAKVDMVPGGCWMWTGALAQGYGYFCVDGLRPSNAHRFSWETFNGPIPEGLSVLHQCDVRACVNPEHLFVGTQAANMRDMSEKGRAGFGERNGGAKLSDEDAERIRSEARTGTKQAELAKRFGVTVGHVWKIVHGHTRKQTQPLVRVSPKRLTTPEVR